MGRIPRRSPSNPKYKNALPTLFGGSWPIIALGDITEIICKRVVHYCTPKPSHLSRAKLGITE